MLIVHKWFKTINEMFETWFCHMRGEATKAEIEELEDYSKERERLQAEEDAEEAKWYAEYIQLQEQQALANKQAEAEEYDRQQEENRKFYEEMQKRVELNEFLEEYEYRCPHCGTPWARIGRCKPCDRAFGRD